MFDRAAWMRSRLMGIRHADEFVDARQHKLDLHWSVLQECCGPGANDDFWKARVPVKVGDASTHVLCPADQLLHVCTHGARSNPLQPVNWVADAMMVLDSSGAELDWRRLREQTAKRRLAVPMREALWYLRTGLGAAIPSDVLQNIERLPTSRTERLEHRVKMSRRKLVGSLPVLWFDHSRLAERDGFGRQVLGFPRYLQVTFRTRTLWGLPVAMLVLAVKRVTARWRRPAH